MKPNIILAGDMLDDAAMADKIKYKNIMKIGFCHNLHMLDAFKKNFDVVLLSDKYGEADMSFINNLVQEIII